jgi:prepilin-type N-terminal cleavage/methylation domain-containing protein
MSNKDSGFTILELLVVVIVIGIIVAMAIPQALTAVKAYRLHTDTAAVAAQLNVTRFRATSQNAPFRLNIVTTTSPATFAMERLCGGTPVGTDSSCTGSAYLPRTSGIEGGVQVIARGNSFTTTNPGGATYPGTITGGSAATTFYFNTRGMPVTSSGNPLSSGGAVIYVTNNAGLTDAVVVTVGGRISTYQWRPPRGTIPGAWTSR